MRVTQHPSNNAVLRAPASSTVEECRPAPITRVTYEDGTDTVAAYWLPTEAERKAIAEGSLIRVEVMGTTMPPMLLGTE